MRLAPSTFAALTLALALDGCRPKPPPTAPAAAPAPVAAAPGAPTPSATAPIPSESVLALDGRGVHFVGEPVLVPEPADPSRGADAAFKRSGPNDLYLVPLAEALARAKNDGRLHGRLPVSVDPSTPYRLLIEVLYTAGQSEIGLFELSEAGSGRSFSFEPPRAAGQLPPPLDHPTLNLLALIVHDGISIKATGGNVAPGCNGVGAGIAIPRRGPALDLASFNACVAKVRASNAAFAGEDHATIVASADIPFRELMDVALALQGPKRDIFPKLALGVPK